MGLALDLVSQDTRDPTPGEVSSRKGCGHLLQASSRSKRGAFPEMIHTDCAVGRSATGTNPTDRRGCGKPDLSLPGPETSKKFLDGRPGPFQRNFPKVARPGQGARGELARRLGLGRGASGGKDYHGRVGILSFPGREPEA